ncbi:hypothetical protein CHA01nite_36070 [Chryseobacterium hagamense]|uniref:Uncharacterized protein n=1 Tax=Chryseobacterium hagamense TaxID=395935 RepID=A0A511YRP7_9FLAO|nr:hypothetical protein CHA01nite_36070 [Chryseobacterium hagamense]
MLNGKFSLFADVKNCLTMKKKITLLLFGVPLFSCAQSAIGSINSKAVSDNGFTHPVEEI